MTNTAEPLADQPIARATRDGVEYTLLGTAHVSRASVDAVRAAIETGAYDAIAVELCESRYKAMHDPEAWRNLDLWRVIRDGKAGMVAANLALSSYQRRLAEQFGIEPGAELKAAVELASQRGLPLWLIDREISLTLKRAYHGVRWRDRLGIIGGLGASLFERSEVSEEDIEKLKQGDMLQSAFSEFAAQSEPLYRSLIGERDAFMAARLREESGKRPVRHVLAVVGAGHLAGIERELGTQTTAPIAILAPMNVAPIGSRWPKWVGLGLLIVIAAAIGYAFSRGNGHGARALEDWIVFTASGCALGALAAGGHPLSVLAAAISGPLKPFRPFAPSGAFSAGVEMWLRHPRVADFETLRDDVMHWTGWWKNRVSRTLLVFMLTNIGMMIGEWTAGIRILHQIL
ncbi:MAG: TraB/GumN family protein [Proteobacteria bacterium]|nr:TraB/GumN family protein [Pseudomonadota bacterium]